MQRAMAIGAFDVFAIEWQAGIAKIYMPRMPAVPKPLRAWHQCCRRGELAGFEGARGMNCLGGAGEHNRLNEEKRAAGSRCNARASAHI